MGILVFVGIETRVGHLSHTETTHTLINVSSAANGSEIAWTAILYLYTLSERYLMILGPFAAVKQTHLSQANSLLWL